MTEKEAAQILAIIKAANPQIKINDAAGTVKAWVWLLGDYPAQAVLDAAKQHILTSPYFPNPADIRKNIIRGIYVNADQAALQAASKKALKAPDDNSDKWDDERLRLLCEDLGIQL